MPNQVFEKHVWAEIDLDALRQNFRAVKQRAGELPLCAVVKADSYGHGAVQCARVFAEEGAAWLACSCLAEALQLRQAGLTLPILILGHVYASCAADLIRNHITAACYSLEQAEALSKAACAAGGRVQVHLKADTGMGRIGFALRTDFEKAVREMAHACQLPGLEMTGLFQHFAVADETDEADVAYTAEQHALFVKAFQALKTAGHEPALVHCDNSAGVMLHPEWPEGLERSRCMARPGIILYGFDPSSAVRFGLFRPVMKLKTVVSMVKELQPGRVCMDQLMVDVTNVPDVHEDDEAILWGGAVSDSAEDIARKTDTISYEVLCGVARRVPRVYLEHGEIMAVEDWILNN